MKTKVDLLLAPAELEALESTDLGDTTCVVFDVLRATSTIVTALHHGAREVIVVETIEDALARRAGNKALLLAGERGGQRIRAALTGSIDFDLGNSPREFTPATVAGRSVVLTTTNGTRALRNCRGASRILAAAFLNLNATLRALTEEPTAHLLLIGAGTGRSLSAEDALGIGALVSRLDASRFDTSADACLMVNQFYAGLKDQLETAFRRTRNGRRLAADPQLAGDIAFCIRQDVFDQPVQLTGDVARMTRGQTEPATTGGTVPARDSETPG